MKEKLIEAVEKQNLEQDEIRELIPVLWESLREYEQKEFQTVKGLPFCYEMKGNEIFIDRKEKSITKASVALAFKNLVQQGGVVRGPKKLGTFGASYLYPIFKELGLIKTK